MATISSPTLARYARILAVGTYRPERAVDNAEICDRIDSTEDWIVSRSDVRTRRFAGPDETVIEMAVRAGERALVDSGLTPAEVGCVVLATSTYFSQTPAAAPIVAARLGISGGAFDLSAGCAGFCYALGVATDLITQTPQLWTELRDNPAAPFPVITKEGQKVFRWAAVAMAPVAEQALARTLRLPEEVAVAHDVEVAGNTSAASVPLAIEALLESGEAAPGDTALLLAFGAGLVYAGQVVTLPGSPARRTDLLRIRA